MANKEINVHNCISTSVATVLKCMKWLYPIITSHWCLVVSFLNWNQWSPYNLTLLWFTSLNSIMKCLHLEIECLILSFYIIDTIFLFWYCAVALTQFVLLKALYNKGDLTCVDNITCSVCRSCVVWAGGGSHWLSAGGMVSRPPHHWCLWHWRDTA